MKNNVTEIVFILDKSGSMSGFEADTVGGFNSTLERQRGEEGQAYVSTVLFDTHTLVLHDRISIDKVPKMTLKDYRVGGCTALLDAVGGAIKHIGNIHKYARPEDVPQKTVFVIMTDGMENASSQYGSETVKKMIEEKRGLGWEFIFLGADIDSVKTAEGLGIRRETAADYRKSTRGMQASYHAVDYAISYMRRGRDLDSSDWRDELDKATEEES